MTCCQVSCGCDKPVLLDCLREDCNYLTTKIVFKSIFTTLSITVWGGFDDWLENTSNYLIEKIKKIVPNTGEVHESSLKLTEPFDFLQYMKDKYPDYNFDKYTNKGIEFKFNNNELEIEFCCMEDASKFLEEF